MHKFIAYWQETSDRTCVCSGAELDYNSLLHCAASTASLYDYYTALAGMKTVYLSFQDVTIQHS